MRELLPQHGGGQQPVAEHPLVGHVGRAGVLREFDHQRPHQADAGLVALAVAGVDVGGQPVAELDGVLGDLFGHDRVGRPGLALVAMIAVDAEDGHQGAELDPAGVVFGVAVVADEPAGVHAPLGLAHGHGAEHADGLAAHALPAGVDVARPHAVGEALGAEVEVSADRPGPRRLARRGAGGPLAFVKGLFHVEVAEVVEQFAPCAGRRRRCSRPRRSRSRRSRR